MPLYASVSPSFFICLSVFPLFPLDDLSALRSLSLSLSLRASGCVNCVKYVRPLVPEHLEGTSGDVINPRCIRDISRDLSA